MRGVAFGLAFAAALFAFGASASASRVGVARLRGPGADAVREALEAELEDAGHDVVDRDDVDRAARAGRVRPSTIDADFLVGGRVRRQGAAWLADLTLERADARAVRRVRMRGADADQLAERVVRFLGSRVRGFTPGEASAATEDEPSPPAQVATDPEPAPEPEASPAPRRARAARADRGPRQRDRAERPTRRSRTSPDDPLGFRERTVIELEPSAGLLTRSLRFNDDLFARARGYELGGAPALVLRGRLYPFGRTDVPGLRDISIDSETEYAIVADSRRDDGEVYPTSTSGWYLGLGYRYLFGRQALLASFGYGVHGFLIDPAGPATPTNDPRPELPRVRYETLRLGVGLRLAPIAGLVLRVRGTYLGVLDAGGITSEVWYPNAKVTAVETMFGVGYRLSPRIEIRGDVEYRRYGFDLRPQLGDAYIVGGALDQYWLYTLGLTFTR